MFVITAFFITIMSCFILFFISIRHQALQCVRSTEDNIKLYRTEKYILDRLAYNAKAVAVIKFAKEKGCLEQTSEDVITSIDFNPLLDIVKHPYFAGLIATTLIVCLEKKGI